MTPSVIQIVYRKTLVMVIILATQTRDLKFVAEAIVVLNVKYQI